MSSAPALGLASASRCAHNASDLVWAERASFSRSRTLGFDAAPDPRFGTSDRETFEIVLGSDHSIIIQYLDVTNLNDVTVGAENADGSEAVQTYCQQSSPPLRVGQPPANGQLLYFSLP